MKINLNHTDKLNDAIESAEVRCNARLINADDIETEVKEIEKFLAPLLPKTQWKGARFEIDPNAQHFANSYKYTPESTHAVIERGATGWFIVDISRDRCWQRLQCWKWINFEQFHDQIAETLRRKCT